MLGIFNTWSAVGNFVNARILDRFGRVRLLFCGLVSPLRTLPWPPKTANVELHQSGAILSLILHTIMVALYSGTENRVGRGFGIFFVYLYTTCYAFCLDATSYVYCAEIFPAHMRTTGMAICIVAYFAPALRKSLLCHASFNLNII
jgi:MFS family permease